MGSCVLKCIWLSTVVLCLLYAGSAFTADNKPETEAGWQYLENNEGVALFRAISETEELLPFKAVAELEVPYESLVMALVDAERKPSWAPKLKNTRLHNTIAPNTFEYSEYYTTPWPFKDREFLLHGNVVYEEDRVVFSAVDSENISLATKDHIKANIRVLTFVIKPLTQSRTRVEFTFSGDMGGWIPEFVKTIIQKRWPVRFILALRNYVAENEDLETLRYQSLNKTNLLTVR